MVNHSDLFLSQMPPVNTLSQILIFLIFFISLQTEWNVLSTTFKSQLWVKNASAFCSELAIKEASLDLCTLPS